MSSFSSNNRISSVTRFKLLPKVIDTILNSNVLAQRIIKKAKRWSGTQVKVSVKVSKNTTGTSFAGFDTFSTSATDNRQIMAFDPKFYQETCALPLDELWVNQSSDRAEAILDLAAMELQSTAQDMADDIGTLFYSDGTGNGSKDFLGLGAIVDDGTTAATYGGLTRATFTTLNATSTASSGTITLAKMATLHNAISSGSVHPTVGICPETVFSLYEQLLTPQERYMKSAEAIKGGLSGGTGYVELAYKGYPILMDEKATAGVLFFLNEEFLNFYAVEAKEGVMPIKVSDAPIEGNDYSNVGKSMGFSWSDWVKPTNSASLVGHVYMGGEFIGEDPKRNGKLTGITSV